MLDYLHHVDQTKAMPTYTILIAMCTMDPRNRFSRAAMLSGNRQYPNRQMLWKKLIDPPRSYPLIAMIAPPSHTMINTISNSRVLSSALVAADNKLHTVSKFLYLRRKHQTKEERAPQIPVSYLFSLVYCLCNRLDRIKHNPQLLPNPPQVSFLSKYNLGDLQ